MAKPPISEPIKILTVSYRDAAHWGAQNGAPMRCADDIGRVNRKRLEKGLHQLRIGTPQDRLDQLIDEERRENAAPPPSGAIIEQQKMAADVRKTVERQISVEKKPGGLLSKDDSSDHPEITAEDAEAFAKAWEREGMRQASVTVITEPPRQPERKPTPEPGAVS